jgi:hypothetical protein
LDLFGHVPLQDLFDQGRELDPTATRLLGATSAATQLLGRSHARALCQMLTVCAFALIGCASKVGWSPTAERICTPKDPAHVCSRSAPDYGHVIEVGDTELLPGECAVLSDTGRGGLIQIETRDPQGERARRWIRAPRSKVTILELREDGDPKVSDRRSCDGAPFSTP